ncbi:LysE family translocator [Corynebacterium guangdongense]|uniref:Threonine efflux protein n=1 Tax=Corynebacterium guangdongense TaxID=1783348 RepID=A0ABU1ZYM6_9CORY|nr:LysE family translocator [Corynebacterium guangdongense]MDR7330022.1 threonine efflux protein [Corynebacterium guangdongense]WJZ18580.1 Threonine efflux protein [Corynebacterium guangdongense]
MSPADLVGLILLNLVGVASPGPDIVLILRTATRSRRHAVAVTLGIQVGVLFWCTLTVLGAAALLTAFPGVLGVVQILGGGWLLWLGYGMLRGGLVTRKYPPADIEDAEGGLGPVGRSFRLGLTTNLSNPKIVLFLAALIAPLLPPSPSVGTAVVAILALSWSSLALQLLIALVVSTKTVRRRLLRASAYIDIGAGVFFLAAGAVLIVRGVADVLG